MEGDVVASDVPSSSGRKRRRRSQVSSATSGTRAADLKLSDYAALSAPVLAFTLAHFFGGAAEPTAALWFTALIALLMPAMIILGDRRDELGLIWPGRIVAGLFALVLLVAVWTLVAPARGTSTPWANLNGPGAITWDKSSTLIEIAKLCGLAGLFSLGCLAGGRKRRVAGAVRIILTLGAVWAAVGLLLIIGGASQGLEGLHLTTGGRLTSGFQSANSGATVYGILAVLSVASLARAIRNLRLGRTPKRSLAVGAALACVLLFTTCLMLTASRMGVAATAFAIVALLVWETFSRKERPSRRLILLALAGATAAVFSIGGADLLWSRLENVDSDAATRGVIFSVHWNAFLQSPLFGHGLGSFSAVNAQQMTPENYGALRIIGAAHNVYIQWLEETGVLGALPMFALIVLIIATAIRRSALLDTGATLQRGLIAANLVLLIHGATDYAIQVPSIAAFWAYLLGLQFAYGKARTGKPSA
ncbi:O-antigen ligase family protein [Brevundimonas sp. SL130]|uniref:O-antigen ligase family protein n=1 Tax=Brevundimonas sp. SL130 TaxID=2995143 RepID=UPI00226C661C|nr:O-antigen ligase family protein [Brevundimonas sp. SL130]WAC59212.1 O-antigen ligase family protein [Brevundimonas sp. SL130]